MQAVTIIGTGLATIDLIGAGVGIGGSIRCVNLSCSNKYSIKKTIILLLNTRIRFLTSHRFISNSFFLFAFLLKFYIKDWMI